MTNRGGLGLLVPTEYSAISAYSSKRGNESFSSNSHNFSFRGPGQKSGRGEEDRRTRTRRRRIVEQGEGDGENSPFIVECLRGHNLNERADRANEKETEKK